MRITLSLLAVLFLAWSPALAQETAVTAESSISSVTVYPDRALVTRKATVPLKKGAYKILFPGLPGEAQEDSVRITGRGTAGAKIGTVEVRKEYLEAIGKEAAERLQAELQQLKDEDRGLSDLLGIAGKQRDFYSAIQFHNAEIWSREITIGKPAVEDWAGVVAFFEKGQKDAASEARKLDVERRVLKDKMDALQKRLDEVLSANPRQRISAEVEVLASSDGSLDLDLGYVVPGAAWNPLYEARADTDTGLVEITYQGQVSQRTSEDWKAVLMTLSTARPAVGASPPELMPWYVRIYEPVPLLKAKRGMMQKDEMMRYNAPTEEGEVMAGAAAPAAPAEVMTAQAETGGTSVLFKAMTKQDVPSDGSSHKVTLSVDTFKAAFEYYTVPKLAPYAYLKGILVNDRDYPLLPGQAAVFIGDDYLGKSVMPLTAPGEKLKLALGIDEGVKVKRELMSRHEEDTGIISKTRRVTFAYKITLESYKKNAQKITVQDQLPVSQQ